MKILSFNILKGGRNRRSSRIPYIKELIKEAACDVAVLQEANNFEWNNHELLGEIGDYAGLEHKSLSYCPEMNRAQRYHVATLSRYPFKKIEAFKERFRNGGLQTLIESDFGEIAICNVHLNPFTERERLEEIEGVLKVQRGHKNRIILGDLNSLSFQDKYNDSLIESFNETQLKKFSEDGKIKFDVVKRIREEGYVDSAVSCGVNDIKTVPTESNKDPAHNFSLRLDYIFVSEPLVKYIKDFHVIRTDLAERASDHYPILLNLEK